MEDHLRNKGRLQREWEALCRYEAEPSAREAALQTQCTPLNRPGAPLPFDHSRVVLNHLANAEGFDYINASTIVLIIFIRNKFQEMNHEFFFIYCRLIMILEHQLMLLHKVPYHQH